MELYWTWSLHIFHPSYRRIHYRFAYLFHSIKYLLKAIQPCHQFLYLALSLSLPTCAYEIARSGTIKSEKHQHTYTHQSTYLTDNSKRRALYIYRYPDRAREWEKCREYSTNVWLENGSSIILVTLYPHMCETDFMKTLFQTNNVSTQNSFR